MRSVCSVRRGSSSSRNSFIFGKERGQWADGLLHSVGWGKTSCGEVCVCACVCVCERRQELRWKSVLIWARCGPIWHLLVCRLGPFCSHQFPMRHHTGLIEYKDVLPSLCISVSDHRSSCVSLMQLLLFASFLRSPSSLSKKFDIRVWTEKSI